MTKLTARPVAPIWCDERFRIYPGISLPHWRSTPAWPSGDARTFTVVSEPRRLAQSEAAAGSVEVVTLTGALQLINGQLTVVSGHGDVAFHPRSFVMVWAASSQPSEAEAHKAGTQLAEQLWPLNLTGGIFRDLTVHHGKRQQRVSLNVVPVAAINGYAPSSLQRLGANVRRLVLIPHCDPALVAYLTDAGVPLQQTNAGLCAVLKAPMYPRGYGALCGMTPALSVELPPTAWFAYAGVSNDGLLLAAGLQLLATMPPG